MSGAGGAAHGGGLRWERALLVAAKELRDTLRDRRTLLMMVLVPTLLYPLLGIGVAQLTLSTMARIDREGYTVGVQGPTGVVAAALSRDPALALKAVPDAAAAVLGGAVALGVVAAETQTPPPQTPAPGPGPPAQFTQARLEVLYDSTSARSKAGLDRLQKVLDAEIAARRAERLTRLRVSEDLIAPVRLKERSVASEARTALSALAPVVGILLILLSLMGAFYPAIDLVAGERERGTLEPLLCTPTTRLELLAGKYLCLLLLSLSTCLLNLLSMVLTTGLLLRSAMPKSLSPALHLPVLAELLLATLPVLLLVCALLLLTAVFARSFKDAQNLMTPVYLLILVPALGALLPDSHLTSGTALVPILGNVLFMKDAFGGGLRLGPALLTLSAGGFYAALAIAAAARVFDRPDLVGARMGDEGLATLAVRVGPGGQPVLTLTGALGIAGVCLALMIQAAPRLQLWDLRAGLVLTQIGLLLLPVLLGLRLCRVPIRSGLSLILPRRGQPWLGLAVGAILTGAGMMALSLLLWGAVVEPLLQPPADYLRALSALRPRGGADTALMLLVAALLPALCEEALCRGLLLTAARRVLGATAAVVLSACFFAVLHLDPYRFLLTLVAGAVLGAVAVRGGSILFSALSHLTNNALGLLLSDLLARRFQQVSPAATLIALGLGAAVLLTAGLWLLGRARPTAAGSAAA